MKTAMLRLDPFVSYLLELLVPLGPIAARPMFGGVGLYYEATMFGLIAGDALFLKVGESNLKDYDMAGQAPFSYETKNGINTIRSYWSCPPELLDDPDAFRTWVRKAIDAAIVAARTKPRSRRKRL